MALASPEAAAAIAKHIQQAGGNATWDRLAEHLEQNLTGRRCFFISRTIDAAAASVFDKWTSAEALAKWLPPPGTTLRFVRSDIEVGKSALFIISGPHFTMPVRMDYVAIEAPARIVYAQQFVDDNEQAAAPPGAQAWPATLLTTVTFAQEAADRTRVTVKCEAHGPASQADVDAFVKERPGMTLGWTASFDKLQALLPS